MSNAKPINLTPDEIQKFEVKVSKSDTGCWAWDGQHTTKGYGAFTSKGKTYMAHRVAYALLHGNPASDLDIDHLCRNRGCVNPAHLEAVSHRENTLRGNGFGGRNARKTHCNKGHEYTQENTSFDHRGVRVCAICDRESAARGTSKYLATEKGRQKKQRDLDRLQQQRVAQFEEKHPGIPYSIEAARRLGQPRGEAMGAAKLKAEQVIEIRVKYAQGGFTFTSLAKEYQVGKSTIEALISRRTWRHV